jgi:hypothetical protein
MVQFADFAPTTPANLKDNITFRITELGPFDPLNHSVSLFPEGSTSFVALTDTAATTAASKEAILYINVNTDANADKILLDNLSLAVATQAQVIEEVQRVAPLRAAVRATSSSFVEFKFDGKVILTQSDKLAAKDLKVTTTMTVKGEILDRYKEFSTLGHVLPTAFTNFVISSTTNFATVKSVTGNTTIQVDNPTFFQQGGFITIINPAAQLDGALRNGYLTDPDSFPPRDIIFLKVVSINPTNSTLTLAPTTLSPILTATPTGPAASLRTSESLFSVPDIQAINGGTLTAISGIPVLFDHKAAGIGYSLTEANTMIEAEIPYTRIYAPKIDQPNPTHQYIGNLDRTSLAVSLYDDDQEAPLIKQGEAQPGVGVDYKLITTTGSPHFGDVIVTIKLTATPAIVPILGIASAGASAVKLSVRIASTPGRLQTLGQGGSNIQTNSTVNQATLGTAGVLAKAINLQSKVGTAASNFSQAPQTPGEYYFNFQIKDSKGNLVNLNKYGTIRIFDTISFYSAPPIQGGTLLGTAMVHGVDTASSLIILDKPLSFNLSNGAVVQIPQTPLNPGRKYRITMSCVDRG